MTDFEKNLSNVPNGPTDPKLLFGSLIAEHNGLISRLKLLSYANNQHLRGLRDCAYMNEEIYNWISDQLSYIEVKSFIQPNINQIPSWIKKTDIVKAVTNIGPKAANKDLFALNVSNSFGDEPVDLKTLDLEIDPNFISLLPPSVSNILLGIMFNADDNESVAAPIDLVLGVINNLLDTKKGILKEKLSYHYSHFVLPFLEYQMFLEENGISDLIDRLFLIERFFLETTVLTVPIKDMSYSNSLLWSKYFNAIFLYEGRNRIRFFNSKLPDLTSTNFDSESAQMVGQFVDIIQNQQLARWCNEIMFRCNYIINQVDGSVQNTTLKRTFEGLDISV